MFSIIRSRAIALPTTASAASRLVPTTFRTFTTSLVSREYERREFGGGERSGPRRDFGGDRRSFDRPRRDNGGGERRSFGGPRREFGGERRDNRRAGGFDSARQKNDPSPTIWVGNIPFGARPEAIQELFTEYGNVLSVRLGVSPTGESKGFAHVDFSDVDGAQAVMQAQSESQFYLDGRGLFMDFAGPANKPAFPPSPTLHFSNYNGDEAMLEEALKEHADVIQSIHIMRHPQTGESNRFGFVECKSTEDATAIMELYGGKEIAYGETLKFAYARGKRVAPRLDDGGGEGYGFGSPRGGEGEGPMF
ncbi:hypothetical protein K439DRAFT_1630083 [Ramaria rubella]|nr:hypothetical protein K439DRAFT_1630083 [Ramaria rubella]